MPDLKHITIRYPEDCLRIVDVCMDDNIYITPPQAQEAWEDFSERYSAQWLRLPESDEELLAIVCSCL